MQNSLKYQKQQLRSQLKLKRDLLYNQNIDYTQVFEKIQIIVQNQLNLNKPLIVSGFYPIKNEINCIEIIQQFWKDKDIYTCLPIQNCKNDMLEFRSYSQKTKFKEYAFKILGPDESNQYVTPNIILVPLLGFDNQMNRLGYGGGFYDKLIHQYILNQLKFITIGLAFDFQKLDYIPTDLNDQKINYIVTEKKIYKS